jgi:putative sigma-54 modulation protein
MGAPALRDVHLSEGVSLMDIQIHARNFHVSERLNEHVEKKLNRLDRYLPHISEIHVELAQEHYKRGGDRAIVQLTVRNSRGVILRAEEKSQNDIFAAVDAVVDKMHRQISRFKGKRRRRAGDRFEVLEPELAATEEAPVEADEIEDSSEIVRRKQLELTPMGEEEAIEQIELLGHDFFVFYNAENSKVNVLYRREGGGYGLLIPNLS